MYKKKEYTCGSESLVT